MSEQPTSNTTRAQQFVVLFALLGVGLALLLVSMRFCGSRACLQKTVPQQKDTPQEKDTKTDTNNAPPPVSPPPSVKGHNAPPQTHQQIRDAVKAQVKEELKSGPEINVKSKSSGSADFRDEPVGNVPSL